MHSDFHRPAHLKTEDKRLWAAVGIVGLAALLILPGTYGILFQSGFFWGVSHFVNFAGGLQCLAIMAVGVVIVCAAPKFWFAVCVCCILLISVWSGVPVPVLCGWLYWECMFLVGRACLPRNKNYPVAYAMLAGVSVLGAGMMLMSVLQLGTILWLRGGFIVITAVAAIAMLLTKKRHAPLAVRLWRFSRTQKNRFTAVLMVVGAVFLAMLFAKSAIAYDYDSQWYSLRSAQVLVGEHSIFDNLNMSAFVYFYPKLEEFLYLPLSGTGEFSFLYCVNIFFLPLLGVSLYRMSFFWAKRLSVPARLLLVLSLLTIPSVVNIATTAKSDIMGTYFCIAAVETFLDYYYENRRTGLFFAVLALGLCTGTKATFLLWGGLIFLTMFASLLQRGIFRKQQLAVFSWRQNRASWLICLSGVFLVLGIHFRTLLLTGYPTYPLLVNLYQKLGLEPKNGALTEWSMTSISDLGKQGAQIVNAIFAPQNIGNLVIQWFSTIWLFLLVLTGIFWFLHIRRFRMKRMFMPVLTVLYVAVSFLQIARTSALDGNYMNVPFLILSVYCAAHLAQGSGKTKKKALNASLALFVCLQIVVCYFTHPSWSSGIVQMSLKTATQWNKTQTYVTQQCELNQITEIKEYAENNLKGKRVLVSSYDIWYCFPWRSEKIYEVQSTYFSNRNWDGSYENGKAYMEQTGTCAIAVMKDDETGLLEFAHEYAEDVGVCEVIETETAWLFHYNTVE